jgi:hypothetical protein
MKNIFLKLTGLFLVLLIGLSSCMEDPIKEAQEAYDYNAIIPKVLGINAPASVVQTLEATVSVNYFRGGSTWEWSAQGATIKSVSEDKRSVVVLFDQAPADLKAKITVVETTYGGVQSEPRTVEVVINPFCVLDINVFLGAAICNEPGYGDYEVFFTLDETVPNRIHNDNHWDWAAAGSTLYYDLSGDINQIVTIPNQPWVAANGATYYTSGSGTYDTCQGIMVVDFEMKDADGDLVDANTHTFTF